MNTLVVEAEDVYERCQLMIGLLLDDEARPGERCFSA